MCDDRAVKKPLSLRCFAAPLAALSLVLAACDPPPPPPATPVTASSSSASDKPSELVKVDLVVGTGAEAKKGSAVTVDYVGTLETGEQFDSSKDRGKPFSFIVGQSAVIEGWHRGVVGMRVGGKRKLVIPPALGYGDQGQPPTIPGHATLLFEIELLHVVE
jgi:FKBP-type peptidyl-prolyl cis-trans isomerase